MENKKIKVIDIIAPKSAQEAAPIKIVKEPAKEEKLTKLAEIKKSDNKVEEKIEQKPKEVKIENLQEKFDFTAKKFERVEIKEEIKKEDIKESLAFAPELKKKEKSKIKKYVFLLILILLVGGISYSALKILPRVEIKIIAKKYPWNYGDWIIASKNSSIIDALNKKIPAEIFSDKKNISLPFPANGKKHVERKSKGEITIYNSYSSDSQILVSGSRFEAPDGKIFRLDQKITVPGAKIKEGKIEPSSIKAMVTADKVGEEYNIEPVGRFTIPGLKGTPKYNSFYASSDNLMKGGFVGELFYPTAEDIKSAKEKTEIALKESLFSYLISQIPKDFRTIDEVYQFNILKETADNEADESGNFLYSLEGELKIIAFKEFDILKLMAISANKTLAANDNNRENFEAKEYDIKYGASRFDFGNGELAILINYSGIFWQPLDINAFKNSIIKEKENELKMAIFALGGIEKATVSFWPFWVKSVPNNAEKIKVFVE